MIKKISVFIVFIVFSLNHLIANVAEVKFYKMPNQADLSGKIIRCMIRDSYGYMWFGSKDGGLNKYDGEQFVTYKHNKRNPNSLISNEILCLWEDNSGNIWIGTKDGLSIFNPVNNVFTNYKFNASDSVHVILANAVTSIKGNKNGDVWIGTTNGITLWNTKTNIIKKYLHDSVNENTIGDNSISVIHIGKNDDVWIGCYNGGGLSKYDANKDNFVRIILENNSIESMSITDIDEDAEGSFWIGTKNGVYRYDVIRSILTHYNENKIFDKSLTSNMVLDIAVINKEQVWVATSKGLSIINGKTNQVVQLVYNPADAFGISSNGVISLYNSPDGFIWLGTADGVDVFDPKINMFTHYRQHRNIDFSMVGDVVTKIIEDNHKRIWVGTDGAGISVIDEKKMIYKNYTKDNNSAFSSNIISSLYEDRYNDIWIGTYDGIVKYNSITNKFQAINGFKGVTVYAFYQDLKDFYWIATNDGLVKYHPSKGIIKRYSFKNSPSDREVSIRIIEELDGVFWLASLADGLFKFDPEKGNYVRYSETFINEPNRLKNDFIKSLYIDEKKMLWIGHLEGFDLFDTKSGLFKNFKSVGNIINFAAFGIQGDKQGNLWMCTKKGNILKYNPKKNTIEAFDESYGIQERDFIENSTFLTNDGKIYFGGANGFNVFYPENIVQSEYVPPIAITSFSAYEKNISIGNQLVLNENPAYTKTVQIKSSYKIFTINYSLLNYSLTRSNVYRYRLVGFDKDWNEVGSQNKAIYTNLKQGRYFFEVQGATENNKWTRPGAVLEIIIMPPFWKSWWFIITMTVIAIIIGYLMYLNKMKMVKRRQIILERQVAERTSKVLSQKLELELQQKEIEFKNLDITNSIEYAQQIQLSILPPKDIQEKLLPECFILFKPKAIVSGDFFWIEPYIDSTGKSSNNVLFAAIDCTGHGVPGALMSIVGYMLLNQAVREHNLSHPNLILNYLDKEVQEILRRSARGSRDGMDIALCKLNKDTLMLEYAGAVNDLLILRDNKIITINATPSSVGSYLKENVTNYTNHQIQLQKGDILYLMSDGYYDQFGGNESKRYTKKRLLDKFITINEFPLDRQKENLEKELTAWMKNESEQLDDILIIGVRV